MNILDLLINFKQITILKKANRKTQRFTDTCNDVLTHFNTVIFENELKGNDIRILDRQKKAIIGVENEVSYFKSEIKNYLIQNNLMNTEYPSSYHDLVDAIFHSNWGLDGIAPWKELENSPSAKIIGGKIYFLINGKMELQEQSMTKERFEQLKKALLLDTPIIKGNLPYYELYMTGGERITIYTGNFTKSGQDIMIFRKYIVEQYSFEELAKRNTIPKESVSLFQSLAQVGFNVLFSGAVRTGKTTFLATWQSMEDPKLEGVLVETDPEIPMHKLLPTAPIMQLLADGEDLRGIVKNLMRSDADYLIMAESRDGFALNLSVEMANRGTRRSKTTVHLTDVNDICLDIAQKIINDVGGNLDYTIMKVAKSFHYVIELIQLPDKSQKRVKGVYEIRYDNSNFEISIRQIMKYNIKENSWSYYYDVDPKKEEIALEENYEAYKQFKDELKKLSDSNKMDEKDRVVVPFYAKMITKSVG